MRSPTLPSLATGVLPGLCISAAAAAAAADMYDCRCSQAAGTGCCLQTGVQQLEQGSLPNADWPRV